MNHKISKNVQATMPCGNPKRYNSRDVVRMPQGSSQNKESDGMDTMETASERHLQTLLQRQVKKDITLADQFSQHRSFSLATSHAPGVDKLVGIHNFEHYKVVNDLDSKVDYLRHCGLDDEEITIMLQKEMEIESPGHRYGADPDYKAEKLREIERKITEKEKSLQIPDKFQGALELSRQDRDLDQSIAKKYGQDSGIPTIITTEKKFLNSHPDDPINHIPEILNAIKVKRERESRRDRRKRRKLERRQKYYSSLNSADEEEGEESNGFPGSIHHVEMSTPNTELLSQSEAQPIISDSTVVTSETSIDADRKSVSNTVTNSSTEIYQNHVTDFRNGSGFIIKQYEKSWTRDEFTQNMDSVKTGTNNVTAVLREIESPVQILSPEEIEKNRLTMDEIKAIDKFQNYLVGEPNKTVYVKNLHSKVTEKDLVSLFGSFQSAHKPKLVFKLLSGRMKGQAFITFPDEVTAGEAIQLINGYKLKDKPVIVTFGKKH